jgi:hypothetical protein
VGGKYLSMENLDKCFFEEMEKCHPFAIDVFKRWVSEYIQKREWKNIIEEDVEFEHLPIEMQQGIMNRFFIETYAGKEEYNNLGPRYKKDMAESIEQLQSRLRPKMGMN